MNWRTPRQIKEKIIMEYKVVIENEVGEASGGTLDSELSENELSGTKVTINLQDENGNEIQQTGKVVEIFEILGY